MASTYTTSLTLTKIGNGEQSGTWGTTTNTNWDLVADSVAGVAQITISGVSGATLSVANGTTDQARNAVIVVTGAASGVNAIVAPLTKKVYIISNQTTGGFALTIGASTGSTVTIANGLTTLVYCDGTNFFSGITGFTGGNLSITGTITATGTITGANFATSGGVPQFAGGTTGQIPYQTGANATAFTPAPTAGAYLSWTGSAYVWSAGSVTTATNLAGGVANSVPYQTSPGNTAFLTPTGATPLTLQYNGSTLSWAAAGAVSSFSGGTTGLLPGSPGSTGNIVLSGTLIPGNGGTGVTSATGGGAGANAVLSLSPTITTPNITGVTNGSVAAAGNVGQLLTASTGAPVNLTSGNNLTLTTLSLPAGDWDIWGWVTTSSNPFNYCIFGVNDAATLAESNASYVNGSATIGPCSGQAPMIPYNTASSVTIYLVINTGFSSGSPTANGKIYARRVR